MTRRKKHGQQVIPPKRSTRTDDVDGLVSVTEVTPDNVEEILGRFFTGPGIDGSIAAEGPMIDDDQLLRPVELTQAEAIEIQALLHAGARSIRRVADDWSCHPMAPADADGMRYRSGECNRLADLIGERLAAPSTEPTSEPRPS